MGSTSPALNPTLTPISLLTLISRAGLHAGTVIVSECGSARRQLALFGDTMNVAARLCEYGKTAGEHLVVSPDLLRSLAVPPDLTVGEGKSIALRGRQEPIEVHVIHEAVTTAVAAA